MAGRAERRVASGPGRLAPDVVRAGGRPAPMRGGNGASAPHPARRLAVRVSQAPLRRDDRPLVAYVLCAGGQLHARYARLVRLLPAARPLRLRVHRRAAPAPRHGDGAVLRMAGSPLPAAQRASGPGLRPRPSLPRRHHRLRRSIQAGTPSGASAHRATRRRASPRAAILRQSKIHPRIPKRKPQSTEAIVLQPLPPTILRRRQPAPRPSPNMPKPPNPILSPARLTCLRHTIRHHKPPESGRYSLSSRQIWEDGFRRTLTIVCSMRVFKSLRLFLFHDRHS